MENQEHGLIDNGLRHIKDVYRYNQAKMDAVVSEQEKFDRLCELNVMEQVMNVCHTTMVQNARKAGKVSAV